MGQDEERFFAGDLYRKWAVWFGRWGGGGSVGRWTTDTRKSNTPHGYGPLHEWFHRK